MAGYSGRGLHGQTVEAIGLRIVSGEIGQSDTIDIAALKDQLGVSSTAMREALKVLAAKGLVDARQKRGTYVLPRDSWNLLDEDVVRWQFSDDAAHDHLLHHLHEVRMIVEPAAVALAARRRTEADLADLDAAVAAMAEATSAAAAVDADLAFHRCLLRGAHNEFLARMEIVIEAGLAERDRLVHSAHPDDDPVPSHRAVLDAVRAGDAVAARAAMDSLLEKAAADLAHLHPRTDDPTAIPSETR